VNPTPMLLISLRAMAVGSLVAVAFVIVTDAANAAGSGMPWEAPLQRILESIEGPVAKVVAVVIIIVTGLSLAFGDMGGGLRRLIQVVFGLSIAFAATSFFLSFFAFAGYRRPSTRAAPSASSMSAATTPSSKPSPMPSSIGS
jgi:type IV secretion system protein TrbC